MGRRRPISVLAGLCTAGKPEDAAGTASNVRPTYLLSVNPCCDCAAALWPFRSWCALR